MSNYQIKKENDFHYVEYGEGPVLLLLHGLFGALSNFEGIIRYFSRRFTVVVPILPIYELPLKEATVMGLKDYVHNFVKYKRFKNMHVLGNSLGGHIALIFAMDNPETVNSVTLTGSSGLFENTMGSTFPKRGDYEFIKKKTEDTFYDPSVATKDMVDQVYGVVNDRNKALRILTTAKSAIRSNLRDKLSQIKVPTLLIWGKQDKITPPFVGEEFQKHITDSELVLIDQCGHAPMMERPEKFNHYLEKFLRRISSK
ncbi:MAG: alpha/beta hydrolase [Bacteroidota bacterium]